MHIKLMHKWADISYITVTIDRRVNVRTYGLTDKSVWYGGNESESQ